MRIEENEAPSIKQDSDRRCVAFLRGINVDGHVPIKMADLKAAFERMDFLNEMLIGVGAPESRNEVDRFEYKKHAMAAFFLTNKKSNSIFVKFE